MSVKQARRITIITSTFNCAKDFKKTADSIRSQSYNHIQWIVVDGKSSDNTVEIIRENNDIISNWMSESDQGIYDAWNKACRFIDGDWVLFLGAGDVFNDEMALLTFWNLAPEYCEQYSLIYGNVYISKSDGKLRYLSRKPRLNYWEYGRVALPNHQGVFHRANLFQSDKSFDASLKIVGDSKFMMQALQISGAYHIDIVLSRMQDDGISNNRSSVRVARREIKKVCKDLNIKVPLSSRLYAQIRDSFYLLGYTIIPSRLIDFLKQWNDTLRRSKL